MRRRPSIIICVAAFVPLVFMAVVVLSGEVPIVREFVTILGGGPSGANNVTALKRSEVKLANLFGNATDFLGVNTGTGIRRYGTAPPLPATNATATPEANIALGNNAPASPIAPPMDADSKAKLRYLSLVYNEPVTEVALFDRLSMIYRNTSVGLPPHLIPCFVFPYGYDCLKLWQQKCTMGRRSESSQDTTLLTETQWPSPKTIVGDNEWLEVTRWGMDEGNGYGCFFNVRRGSGVFVNTKKTILVQNDTDAKENLNMSEHEKWANYCPHARQRGYDSVQIVNAIDGNSNQFLLCTGTCASEPVTGACIKGVELRTGVNHDKPCECSDDYPLINCGAAITPKGKQHICDQRWEDKSASDNIFVATRGGKAGGKLRHGKFRMTVSH